MNAPFQPPITPSLNAERLPASAGWGWLRRGLEIFRLHPTQLLLTALNAMFVALAVMWLPLIGPFAALALLPALTMFILEACRVAQSDQPFSLPQVVGAWLRSGGLAPLLRLGLAYSGTVLLVTALAMLPFLAGLLDADGNLAQRSTEELVRALRKPLLLAALASIPVTMAFWYAPMLVAWHGLSIRKALFFSLVACWRNRWAFLVYALAMAGVATGLDLVLSLLEQVMGLDTGVVRMIGLPLQIVFLAVVYCSFYPSYATVFRSESAPDSTPA